jgi:hypothetical protein
LTIGVEEWTNKSLIKERCLRFNGMGKTKSFRKAEQLVWLITMHDPVPAREFYFATTWFEAVIS